MRSVRLGSALAVVCAALLSSTTSRAQLAPGFDEPQTLLEAAKPTFGYACFLVSTGRPWPGIDRPLLGMDGEGLVVEATAEPWFAEVLSGYKSVRYSSLNTPEGKLWIGFAADDKSCTIGAIPADRAAFSAEFLKNFPHSAGRWKAKKQSDEAGKITFTGKLPGSPEVWTAQYWESPASSGAVFARMTSIR